MRETVRGIFLSFIALCFLSATALSQSAPANADTPARDATPNKSSTDNRSESSALEDRLRALEQVIERQQREIQALREAVEKQGASRPMENASSETPPAAQPASENAAQDDATRKKVDELYKKFGPIRFSGDIRFRMETFSNQGFDSPADQPFRNRLRIRARLALDGSINKNFDWGLRLASGIFTDPISTNQTLTDFFERKGIGLERAFVRYDSKTDRVGVQLVAGKFEPTFRRTQLVWDDDVNVEGASEAIYFKTGSALEQIKLIALQLPFNEVSGGDDSVLYGGQAQSDWKLSPKVTANFNVGYYDWVRADSIARAFVDSTTQINGGINNGAGVTGRQNGRFGTTNRIILNSDGNPVGFVAGFNLFDVLGNVTWQAKDRFPVTFTFDYVHNFSGRIDDENNGYWSGVQVGQSREKGDWLFGYTYARIEQDAVLVPFNFSDILASNSRTHMPVVAYQVANGVTLQWMGLFSKRVNKVFVDSPFNRTANRMQFDVVYKF
ncbi:MAG: putative porin [Acidobacteriota bacterium]